MRAISFLLTAVAMAGLLFLCGCSERAETPPVPPTTAGAVVWSPEDARRLVAERDSHAAKAATLEVQLQEVRRSKSLLEVEETRIAAELRSEREAAVRVQIYWWLGFCGLLAGACVVAGFVFPGASRWLWRGAVGLTCLAAVLGVIAALLSWWIWVGAGLIVLAVLAGLAAHARATGNALVETVQGVQNLKPVVGNVYKSVMRQAQSVSTDRIVNRVRNKIR